MFYNGRKYCIKYHRFKYNDQCIKAPKKVEKKLF